MTIKAFGCSLTYGHGLPDCANPGSKRHPSPSKLAWPNILGEFTGIEVENHSQFGASIKRNAFIATERTFWKEGDIAVFLWPHKSRYAIIMSTDSITDLGSWSKNKATKYHYAGQGAQKIDVEHDAAIRILGTELVLREQGVKTFHLLNTAELDLSMGLKQNVKLRDTLNVPDKDELGFDINVMAKRRADYGGDGVHPGLNTHRSFAKLLYKKIKDQI